MDRTPASATAATITLDGIGKTYGDGTVAVGALSLEVPAGDLVVLIGPSGCGKSTILRMINRLIEPTNGRVLIDGEDVAQTSAVALRRRIGYVIQHVGLFPHQSIGTNIGTVPRLLGWSRARVRARVDELLDLVGLEPARYRDRYPSELSGGQRQRIGVARALAADPVLLLMDEPFSAVDPIVRLRLQDEFLRLQRAVRKTIVLVTHDLDEAIRLGDSIAVLSEGGVLEQYATPAELLSRPANDFVAQFIGADRGVKRLSVTPIDTSLLAPLSSVNGAGSGPAVPATVVLRDALGALLDGGRDYVVVTGEDGAPLGVLTSAAIAAAAAPDTTGTATTARQTATAPDGTRTPAPRNSRAGRHDDPGAAE